MRPRYIIRPKGLLTTPSLLKVCLGAKRTITPESTRRPDWFQDFFLTYPPIETFAHETDLHHILRGQTRHQPSAPRPGHPVESWMEAYGLCRQFAAGSKPVQRVHLTRDGFPCPPTATTHGDASNLGRLAADANYPSRSYIVRPLRHRSGQGWRLTEDCSDFIEGQEYIQSVYPKNHEYRVIVVRGVPIITLLKRVPDNTPRSSPWNHSCGSVFITVTDPSNDRLRRTDVYERIRESRLFRNLDLVGVDVMYRRDNQYALSEINLCPALQITSNLEKVARHVLSLPQGR